PLLNPHSYRVRPDLRYARFLHPINRQQFLPAPIDGNEVETAAKIRREDVTDLGRRRIVKPLHFQARALPGELGRFRKLKPAISNEKLFSTMPRKQRSDKHRHAEGAPENHAAPCNFVEQRRPLGLSTAL